MKVSEIPEFKDKNHILTVAESCTIYEAAKEMKKFNYGSVVVTKDKKVLGILTERDVLNEVVAKALDVKKTKVSAVMNKNVKTARDSETVQNLLRRMSHGRFRHVPIVDGSKNLIGLVSQGDLVAYSWSQILHLMGDKTKSSFLSHTQVWMMIIAILTYITFAFVMFN
jgi:signal-transduction protein with cAMP-binding, CBS, and nucleotidyltransferase domain